MSPSAQLRLVQEFWAGPASFENSAYGQLHGPGGPGFVCVVKVVDGPAQFAAPAPDGAAAKLRIRDYMPDGQRWWFCFGEKGGRPHTVKAHQQLQLYMEEYLAAAGIAGDPGDWPLFRSARGKTKQLTTHVPPDSKMKRKAQGGITGLEVNAMLKRRLRDARLVGCDFEFQVPL